MEQALSKAVVEKIIELTDAELKEHGIVNEIVRDDVFSVLDSHCIILYYPLPEDDINGYHINRMINDKPQEFVFINTANTTEKQVFAAAHELGHVLKVDEKIIKEFDLNSSTEISEKIINRFAAELLMPEKIFVDKADNILKTLNVKNKISIGNMVYLIVCLMNEFLVEFEAIVRRFNELKKISDASRDLLLKLKNIPDFYDEITSLAKASNFTRLFIKSNNRSIKNLKELVDKANEKQTLTETKIESILKTFGIKQVEIKEGRNPEDNGDSIDIL